MPSILLKFAAAIVAGVLSTTPTVWAGSATGSATDDTGKPLSGVHVEVVYLSVPAHRLGRSGASIKKTTTTGADGRYRIAMDGLPPGEYAANAYRTIANGGQAAQVALLAEDDRPFASNDAVVRNFIAGVIEMSERYPYGNAGVFVLQNAVGDSTDLSEAEVTLRDVASGRTFVKRVRRSGEGLVATGIPFGTYRCSVSLRGTRLRLALVGKDDGFSDSVVHDFTMGYTRDQFRVDAKP